MGLQQAQIGRNHVTDAQMNEIAGHDLGHADLRRLSVPIDKGQMADLRVQRLDGLLRAILVQEAQTDAHQHDAADDQRLGSIADNSRDNSRDKQQQQQVAAQLPDKNRERADAVRQQRVRPIDGQPPARLDAREAHLGRTKLAQSVSDRQRRSRSQLELLGFVHRSGMLRTRRCHDGNSCDPLGDRRERLWLGGFEDCGLGFEDDLQRVRLGRSGERIVGRLHAPGCTPPATINACSPCRLRRPCRRSDGRTTDTCGRFAGLEHPSPEPEADHRRSDTGRHEDEWDERRHSARPLAVGGRAGPTIV